MNQIRKFSTSVKKLITWAIKGTTANVSKDAVAVSTAVEQSDDHKNFREKYKFATILLIITPNWGDPHTTKKIDGSTDAYHLTFNFSKTATGGGSPIGAHYYPETRTIKFAKANILDIVLSEEAVAQAEADAAAKPFVLQDFKKGFAVVWENGE